MRRGMIIMISVGSDSVHMRSMGSLSLIGEEAEIFKYVILRMASNPGTYFSIYRPHHTVLSLFDSNVEALSLTLTCHIGRGMAYRTVRIHPDDRLARIWVFPGKHLS
jgi:hypothetical protein